MQNHQREIGILDFWHKTEFFIPFNLTQELKTKSSPENIKEFTKRELWRIESQTSLWDMKLQPNEYITGFNVYLAMFEHRDLINEIDRELKKQGFTESDPYFQEKAVKHLMREGNTCFAKIRLNEIGSLIPDSIEISTSPWAIGQIRKNGFNSLDFNTFDNDLSQLKKQFTIFYAEYIKENSHPDTQNLSEIPLNGKAICHLIKILLDWANYNPGYDENTKVVTIQVKKSTKEKNSISNKSEETNIKHYNDNFKTAEESAEIDISILNSFFAKDIANVIQQLKRGNSSSTLKRYLNKIKDSEKLDLYSPAGITKIYEHLLPSEINLGHWLSEPKHQMSLMQQFSINTLFKEIKNLSIFSVNGPPGTGKTTLLRDIFAENIIRRANILAKYDSPKDAFEKDKQQISFLAGSNCHISILKPELTGFEMVVASSNNSAVENISKELPQIDSLGPTWLDDRGKPKVTYLQSIIRNIVAQTNKTYKKELGKREPWGLFSIALGKKENRSNFISKFYFERIDKLNFDKELHQSIWSWRKKHNLNQSYSDIRKAFLKLQADILEYTNSLSQYIELNAFLQPENTISYLASKQAECDRLEKEIAKIEAKLADIKIIKDENESILRFQQESKLSLEKNVPGFISRLFNKKKYREFLSLHNKIINKIQDLLAEKQVIFTDYLNLSQTLETLNTEYEEQQNHLKQLEQDLEIKRAKFETLYAKFAHIRVPKKIEHIENQEWQVNGLWIDEHLNYQRSQLFDLALQLHQRWLADVSNDGFGANLVAIQQMLSGKQVDKPHLLPSIWHSLFMIVPVISTTFAAFASQFKGLGKESIGWLFIDEAGQAAPHMAVGALWRAKQALIVGDPLQIEPVLTTENNLIEALKKCSILPAEEDYSPNKISVQNLADWANPFGISITHNGEKYWLGSPLRVHRRCIDPMFTIANNIAYQGKMINATIAKLNVSSLGQSAWVQLSGQAINKHIVKEQVELVEKALIAFYLKHNELPPVYIISPFKAIASALICKLQSRQNWHLLDKKQQNDFSSAINAFCRYAIGTVHTFQGKEQKSVWMVLGCDRNSISSATWAASKPNLLNVALTRAKSHFVMIGDQGVWAKQPYFQEATKYLPVINPECFIEQIQGD